MPKYASSIAGWTPVAHADSASSLANASYHSLRTTAANTIKIEDVIVGGEATSSTVNRMALRRLSTNATTPTNVAPAPLNPLSVASVHQQYSAAATGPTIAATTHLLHLALNTFGGFARWVAAPGEEIWATISTAPNGEVILDSISGIGIVSTTMIAEEV